MRVSDDSSSAASTGKTRKLEAMKKDEVEELLKKYGIKLEKDAGYDCVYVANMAKADYYKSSIADESHLALFVKDYIDDPDGYEGLPFTRFTRIASEAVHRLCGRICYDSAGFLHTGI